MGHATYEITSATGTTLVIDLWYTESPIATTGLSDKADFVLVTHDHWDHVKDVAPLARSGAKVVTQPEVAARLTAEEGVSWESFITANIGGTVNLTDEVSVTMIPTVHSARAGTPAEYILHFPGFRVAHLGDTALFANLKTYGDLYPVDLALIPAGGRFTMGPREAAKAAVYLKAKAAAPMHYKTFPTLVQSPESLLKALHEEASHIVDDAAYEWQRRARVKVVSKEAMLQVMHGDSVRLLPGHRCALGLTGWEAGHR